LLDRETLSEHDIRTGAAVRPAKLDVALEALCDAGRVSPGKHITISGAPGTGKSAMAAWIDFLLSEQGQVCGFYPGKIFQNQLDLFDMVKQLPRRSVAIIDDVHLVRLHVERLKNESDLSLVLLGRAGIFEEMERSQKLPPARRINLT